MQVYLQISRDVKSGFENYIYQSGLPEDTIDDLGVNFIGGYSITAKDPKNSKAAGLLTSLDSIFTTDVSYG